MFPELYINSFPCCFYFDSYFLCVLSTARVYSYAPTQDYCLFLKCVLALCYLDLVCGWVLFVLLLTIWFFFYICIPICWNIWLISYIIMNKFRVTYEHWRISRMISGGNSSQSTSFQRKFLLSLSTRKQALLQVSLQQWLT